MRTEAILIAALTLASLAGTPFTRAAIPTDCVGLDTQSSSDVPGTRVRAPDIQIKNECTSDPLGDGHIMCQEYTTVNNENAYVHGQHCVYANGQVGYACEYANYRDAEGHWHTTSTPPGCAIY